MSTGTPISAACHTPSGRTFRRAARERELLETDHDVLVTLHRFTLATAEQLHQLHGGAAGIKQTQKRLTRLQAEGLAELVTLPQAGRAKAWHLTAAGSAVTATFPEALRPTAPAPSSENPAVQHGREHLLDIGRIHAAFVTDARTRGEACGPLDLVPAPELPTGAEVYRPAAHLAYTAGTGDERHRQRAFIERHRPGVGDEQTAAQLAACARVWEQDGEGGAGRAWERRWRSFPRLLVVLVGTGAAQVRPVMADLRLAAEENTAVAELLATVPAGAARIEDLVQRGPSAPIWHSLGARGVRVDGAVGGRGAGTAKGRPERGPPRHSATNDYESRWPGRTRRSQRQEITDTASRPGGTRF